VIDFDTDPSRPGRAAARPDGLGAGARRRALLQL